MSPRTDIPAAKTITAIECRFLRGDGTPNEPIREVTRYFGVDGTLLAETDPMPSGKSISPAVDEMTKGLMPEHSHDSLGPAPEGWVEGWSDSPSCDCRICDYNRRRLEFGRMNQAMPENLKKSPSQ